MIGVASLSGGRERERERERERASTHRQYCVALFSRMLYRGRKRKARDVDSLLSVLFLLQQRGACNVVRGRVPYIVFYVYTEACSVMHGCILKARANVRIWYVFVRGSFQAC